ncbi:MAG TPA: GNAT family N-acetyltransferase [Marmoricola sp.]|nr:GNAT family N-acetyltransferase [Marmoricola sp.]
MPELQRLSADHASALLAFERDNRAYFAASISDRGEDYFDRFADRHAELLAEQQTGECAYYVLVEDDGSILGRFNLRDIDDGCAVLGYRVAQRVAGQGVATATVDQLCRDVAPALDLRTVRAATADANVASRRVLVKAGFALVGRADPAVLGGKPGSWYERAIVPR